MLAFVSRAQRLSPHPLLAFMQEPYVRKCAFDVGDYGLGYTANSLNLGCDCLGAIHYFDGAAFGQAFPYVTVLNTLLHNPRLHLICFLSQKCALWFPQHTSLPLSFSGDLSNSKGEPTHMPKVGAVQSA
jgi:hypothetical protein